MYRLRCSFDGLHVRLRHGLHWHNDHTTGDYTSDYTSNYTGDYTGDYYTGDYTGAYTGDHTTIDCQRRLHQRLQ